MLFDDLTLKIAKAYLNLKEGKGDPGFDHATRVGEMFRQHLSTKKGFKARPDLTHPEGHGDIQRPKGEGTPYEIRWGLKVGKPSANLNDMEIYVHGYDGSKWDTMVKPIEAGQGEKQLEQINQTSGKPRANPSQQKQTLEKILADKGGTGVDAETGEKLEDPGARMIPPTSAPPKEGEKSVSTYAYGTGTRRPPTIGDLRASATHHGVHVPSLHSTPGRSEIKVGTPQPENITGGKMLVHAPKFREEGDTTISGLDPHEIRDDYPVTIRRQDFEATPAQPAKPEEDKRAVKPRNPRSRTSVSIDVGHLMSRHHEHATQGIEAIFKKIEDNTELSLEWKEEKKKRT